MKNILKVKNTLTKLQKPFERQEARFFENFGQFQCSWIRIRIPNSNPGQPNECGSGSTILRQTHISTGIRHILTLGK
jgi:hypothetical protein